MKYYLTLFLVYLFSLQSACLAQVYLSNQGAFISIKNSALLSVRGDVINQTSGIFNNTDTIDLIGDWQNDGGNQAFDSIGSGIVRLTGSNQSIKGSSITGFNQLSISGDGIKFGLLEVDVDDKLLLNDRELNMSANRLVVYNRSTDAVSNTIGFVSSIADGGLSRYTNQNNSYFFPVGSSIDLLVYRPVYVTPKDVNLNLYNIGFNSNDPSRDGYDREQKELWLCRINEHFYHRLDHTFGSSISDFTFLYDAVMDGNYNTNVQWKPRNLWEKTGEVLESTIGSFSALTTQDWADFETKNFALAYQTEPFGYLGSDTFLYYGSSIELEAVGGNSYSWTPSNFLSCDDCAVTISQPDSSISYQLITEGKDGCRHIDTIYIEVIKDLNEVSLFIPNLITPNGDGANDEWIIRDLDNFRDNEVTILNRWGDNVFQKAPYDNSFNGLFLGKALPEGTYYYLVKIKINGEVKTFDGPLTIIR